jgi:N-acetylmuramoyl-L-alanine amidase-like protein
MTMLLNLADIARRTGYPVVEVTGWKTRTRPGGMSKVETITCHHTANGGAKGDYPSLRVVRDGRPGLPGPLAQYGLGRSGTIYVVAAGLCNHAGVSLKSAFTRQHAIGIEAEAIGTPGAKGDWPAAQMDSYVRLCRALADEFERPTSSVLGHKETCSPRGRKSDPSFDMPNFRVKVRSLETVRKPAPKPPTKPKDFTDMATKQEVKDAAIEAVLEVLTERQIVPNKPTAAQLAANPDLKTTYYTPVGVWANVELDQDSDRDRDKVSVEDLRAEVAALSAALSGLAGMVQQLLDRNPQG